MKVNLLIDNPGAARSGFINVDPYAEDGDQNRTKSEITNLDLLVDDGEANEIVALEVLEYFPGGRACEIIQHWLSKLAHGGRLYVAFVDILEVSRAIVANQISPDDMSELLYGKQEKQWQFKKATFSTLEITNLVESMGYKVVGKTVTNFRAVITIERP